MGKPPTLSMKQWDTLGRLVPNRNLLAPEAVEAFFAWTDSGKRPSFTDIHDMPLLARLDLQALWVSHAFGWNTRLYREEIRQEFKDGLLFLYDCEHADDYSKEQALALYEETMGETTHYRQVRDWWRYGWRAGYPEAFPWLCSGVPRPGKPWGIPKTPCEG